MANILELAKQGRFFDSTRFKKLDSKEQMRDYVTLTTFVLPVVATIFTLDVIRGTYARGARVDTRTPAEKSLDKEMEKYMKGGSHGPEKEEEARQAERDKERERTRERRARRRSERDAESKTDKSSRPDASGRTPRASRGRSIPPSGEQRTSDQGTQPEQQGRSAQAPSTNWWEPKSGQSDQGPDPVSVDKQAEPRRQAADHAPTVSPEAGSHTERSEAPLKSTARVPDAFPNAANGTNAPTPDVAPSLKGPSTRV